MIVLDAGALIALARLEAGALSVRRLLRNRADGVYIHAVNLLEIYYGFEREKGASYAERVLTLIQRAGITTRNDVDMNFLRDASHLKITYRWSCFRSVAGHIWAKLLTAKNPCCC